VHLDTAGGTTRIIRVVGSVVGLAAAMIVGYSLPMTDADVADVLDPWPGDGNHGA
jgi:hypothetical protein